MLYASEQGDQRFPLYYNVDTMLFGDQRFSPNYNVDTLLYKYNVSLSEYLKIAEHVSG